MTARERIRAIRIMEKLEKNPGAARALGIRGSLDRKLQEGPSRFRQGERT